MRELPKRLWLIDGSYLFKAQHEGAGFHFDYKKLRAALEEQGPFFQVHYLDATPHPPTDGQNGFHTWLRSAPPGGPHIQAKLYPLKEMRVECEECGHETQRQVQKGVDVGIATLALRLVDRYDTLVLSTGDGDFIDAVDHIRNTLDKRVELAVFKTGVSSELQSLADRVHWLDDLKAQIRR